MSAVGGVDSLTGSEIENGEEKEEILHLRGRGEGRFPLSTALVFAPVVSVRETSQIYEHNHSSYGWLHGIKIGKF